MCELKAVSRAKPDTRSPEMFASVNGPFEWTVRYDHAQSSRLLSGVLAKGTERLIRVHVVREPRADT